jgi:hypothetical protein
VNKKNATTLQVSRLLTIHGISKGWWGGVSGVLYVSYVIRCRIGKPVFLGSQDE